MQCSSYSYPDLFQEQSGGCDVTLHLPRNSIATLTLTVHEMTAVLGTPAANPRTQFSSTTYCRLFAQASTEQPLLLLLKTFGEYGMQHFSGFHLSLDYRTAFPRPYLAFYPALYPQDSLDETVTVLSGTGTGNAEKAESAGHPSQYETLDPKRENYETASPRQLTSFGPTAPTRLGAVVLARSGDKGANINIGLFVRHASHYPWLQSFLTRARMAELMGDDWRADEYFVERIEFPNLWAVHFVIYGPLGRGVSSCRLLDCLGKGFADYIRDKVVDVPVAFVADVERIKTERRKEVERTGGRAENGVVSGGKL